MSFSTKFHGTMPDGRPRKVPVIRCDKCGHAVPMEHQFEAMVADYRPVSEGSPPPESTHHCADEIACAKRMEGK